MAFERHAYADNAGPSELAADITNSATSFDGVNLSTWPAGGAAGKVVATIDRDLATEERIRYGSRTGNTLNSVERGYGGTAAQPHSAGADLEHTFSAVEADEFNQHLVTTALDHHTQYMRTDGTRHDLTARHAFGGALGTPGTPATLAAGGIGTAGVGAVPPRSDHNHPAPSGVPVSIGTANLEGVSGSFPRLDHQHELGAASIDSSALFAASVVDAAAIAANAVGSSELAAGAVTAGKIAAGGVSATTQIADAIITFAKFSSVAATSFTPTFANVVIGGGSVYGAYFKLGRLVVGFAGFILGAAGNVSGAISFSVPTAVADLTGGALGGNSGAVIAGRAFDSSAGGRWSGLGLIADTGTAQSIATAGSSSAWDGDDPFNWASGDILQTFFCYVAPT